MINIESATINCSLDMQMGETNLCSYSMEGDHPTKKEMVHTSNYHGMWRSQSLHSYSSTYDASLIFL